MPKLPLFQHEPLPPGAIDSFHNLLAHPEVGENTDLISDLLDLHGDPHSPISERLAIFVMDTGLLHGNLLQNALFSSAGCPPASGMRGAMNLQIHQRILACAAAAGFLPAPTVTVPADPRSYKVPTPPVPQPSKA